MRRVFFIILQLLCGFLIYVGADNVKVTLKSGVTITGELKELVTTDHITLMIGGVESVISIDEVSSIEQLSINQITPQIEQSSKLIYGQYQITDTKLYPDSFTIVISDQELTMILVRGGWFNMGYDDRHSLSWDTEPVHQVSLSSYYVSKQLLDSRITETLIKKGRTSDIKDLRSGQAHIIDLFNAGLLLETGKPYRLITEAEWEYVSLMPFAKLVFVGDHLNEICSDIWGKYTADSQVNPQGPKIGNFNVMRLYSEDNSKWKRYKSTDDVYFRIAISADQIQ